MEAVPGAGQMSLLEQMRRERAAYRSLIVGLIRNGGEGGDTARIPPHARPQPDEKIMIDVANPDKDGVIVVTLRSK